MSRRKKPENNALPVKVLPFETKQIKIRTKPKRELTKMEMSQKMSALIREGKMTIQDVGRELKLTPRQVRFAQVYTSKEFFGNAIESYGEANDIDISDRNKRNSASSNAHQALQNPILLLFIDILLDSQGFNDSFVDKQLLFLVTQNADLGVKLKAVAEYNKLKQRIRNSQDININVTHDLTHLSNEELDTYIKLTEKIKGKDNGQNH